MTYRINGYVNAAHLASTSHLTLIPIDDNLWYLLKGAAMSKNTSISLGNHFESFIAAQIESGRYGNASEVVRSGLRLLEEREAKIAALRRALMQGEESGDAGALDFDEIRRVAREPGHTPGHA